MKVIVHKTNSFIWLVGSGVTATLAVVTIAAFVFISWQAGAIKSPCGSLAPVKLAAPEGSLSLFVPEDIFGAPRHRGIKLPETISLRLYFPDVRVKKTVAGQETRQVAVTLYTDIVSQKNDEWYRMRDPLAFWSAVFADEIDAVLAAAFPGQECT